MKKSHPHPTRRGMGAKARREQTPLRDGDPDRRNARGFKTENPGHTRDRGPDKRFGEQTADREINSAGT